MMRHEGCKNVLMVGFHFPPSTLSSGHLRFLAFTKYLPSLGWNPIVLTARANIYERSDPATVDMIPPDMRVYRPFSLDARRHMGFRGKYPSLLARPDRWISWWPTAVFSGLRIMRKYRVHAIWSTYPIMTAHVVARTLSRMGDIPWIADFRDPVASSVAEQDRATVASQMAWEQRVLSRAACSVFTTPGAARLSARSYPQAFSQGRIRCIPNGYDEDDFAGLVAEPASTEGGPLHFVHAGILYPDGRNPSAFFHALAALRRSGSLKPGTIRVTLRGSGAEEIYEKEIKKLGLTDMVFLSPFLPYKEVLEEQSKAAGLLLFQGDRYDSQIPAKLYEYLRLGKPIFSLVGERGDTAAVLREAGGATIAPLNDPILIGKRFLTFIDVARAHGAGAFVRQNVQQYSREHAAELLAKVLNDVSGTGADVSGSARGAFLG